MSWLTVFAVDVGRKRLTHFNPRSWSKHVLVRLLTRLDVDMVSSKKVSKISEDRRLFNESNLQLKRSSGPVSMLSTTWILRHRWVEHQPVACYPFANCDDAFEELAFLDGAIWWRARSVDMTVVSIWVNVEPERTNETADICRVWCKEQRPKDESLVNDKNRFPHHGDFTVHVECLCPILQIWTILSGMTSSKPTLSPGWCGRWCQDGC